ncbi:MAG: hypothetical protein KY476_03550 [Planctomycetes bacterium]|nr:hypothetical protein [Planctomycetota bacterium]
MPAHRIQLRGPWDYEWIGGERDPAQPTSGRVKLPASWHELFGPVTGTVRFTRWFHCPTNLSADERVFVVLEGVGGRAVAAINDQPLGELANAAAAGEFDVTDRLAPRNRLCIVLTLASDAPADTDPWASVALEIRNRERK